MDSKHLRQLLLALAPETPQWFRQSWEASNPPGDVTASRPEPDDAIRSAAILAAQEGRENLLFTRFNPGSLEQEKAIAFANAMKKWREEKEALIASREEALFCDWRKWFLQKVELLCVE